MLDKVAFRLGKSRRRLSSFWGTRIHFVSGQSDWIFNWIEYYLSRYLGSKGIKTASDQEVLGYRNQLIHFVDRYSYLRGKFRYLHPSNKVFLNWFHGDFQFRSPDLEDMLDGIRNAATYLEKVIISCKSSRGVLRELGVEEHKIVNIPLGVDLERFRPVDDSGKKSARDRLEIPADSVCVGCFQKDGVGWGEGNEPKLIKGPDVFLDVVSRLKSKYSKLIIVLTGPSRGYVKKGLHKLNVPYIHRYLKFYPDIVEFYHTLDVLLIPSRQEGGPSCFLESWATGVPVVSTKVGMPEDYIRHGENGILTDVEDIGALVNSVQCIVDDGIMADKIARNALKDVNDFDWKLVADKYYNMVYDPYIAARS